MAARRAIVPLACGLMALAFVTGEVRAGPLPADDRVVREWITRAANEPDVRVIRTVTRKMPVPFATALPSSYKTSRAIERKLKRDLVAEFRRALELESADVSAALCRNFSCATDTSDLSTTRVLLGKGSKTLSIELLLSRGGARIHSEAFWSCYHFRDGGRAIKDLLVKALPNNT